MLMPASPGLRRLRTLAVDGSLAAHPSTPSAVAALGFVQYDPIRRPARAQDLILFQRVTGYRSGDLDRHYPGSGLEEDCLYAYGVLHPSLVCLLHPRPARGRPGRAYRPEGLAGEVLAHVREHGPVHPRDLLAAFGRAPAPNDWGGTSARTTRALEELHYHGLIRVARRDRGVKVYEPALPAAPAPPASRRLRQLTLAIVRLLAPVAEPGLKRAVDQLCAAQSGALAGRRTVVDELLAAGEIDGRDVDGLRYYAPPALADQEPEETGDRVRFVAPFDPVVWDRIRFEHLWGWAYRFEAYTPPAQRRFGYYALPMFLGNRAVGWVNVGATPKGRLDVQAGFAQGPIRGRAFRRGFSLEVDRFQTMLAGCPDSRSSMR